MTYDVVIIRRPNALAYGEATPVLRYPYKLIAYYHEEPVPVCSSSELDEVFIRKFIRLTVPGLGFITHFNLPLHNVRLLLSGFINL